MKAFIKLILYQPLYNALIFLVWLVPDHNVGWAIIVLTVLIRLILAPSSMKSIRQQKMMQDLQPEIQALQEKYKDDKKAQSEALMEFYKVNKVNPLGSCLPLLIQLPILIVLYYVFINGLDTSRFATLLYSWMPRPETINTIFLGLDLAKPDRWIMPIIAAGLQFFQSWQIAPKTKPKEGQEMQAMMGKQMLYLMPLFTLFIAGRFPAALPLYWSITTLFSIVQQWIVFRDKTPVKAKPIKLQKIAKNLQKTIKRGIEVTVRKKGEK